MVFILRLYKSSRLRSNVLGTLLLKSSKINVFFFCRARKFSHCPPLTEHTNREILCSDKFFFFFCFRFRYWKTLTESETENKCLDCVQRRGRTYNTTLTFRPGERAGRASVYVLEILPFSGSWCTQLNRGGPPGQRRTRRSSPRNRFTVRAAAAGVVY